MRNQVSQKNTLCYNDTGVADNVRWINAENIGKTEAELIVIWNELHPDDLVEE